MLAASMWSPINLTISSIVNSTLSLFSLFSLFSLSLSFTLFSLSFSLANMCPYDMASTVVSCEDVTIHSTVLA